MRAKSCRKSLCQVGAHPTLAVDDAPGGDLPTGFDDLRTDPEKGYSSPRVVSWRWRSTEHVVVPAFITESETERTCLSAVALVLAMGGHSCSNRTTCGLGRTGGG